MIHTQTTRSKPPQSRLDAMLAMGDMFIRDARRKKTRDDAYRLRQLIEDHPDIIGPLILDIIADDLAEIVAAAIRGATRDK